MEGAFFRCNLFATRCNGSEHSGVRFGRCAAACATIAADLEPGDDDVEAAIALDLSLEAVEQVAFEFGDLSAT